MPSKLQQMVAQIRSELVYKAHLMQHARHLPVLNDDDRQIVDNLRSEGVCVTSLEDLAISSSSNLLEAIANLLPALPEKLAINASTKIHAGHHSVSPSMKQIVSKYPQVFLWGIEEKLINIVESYIGLPVAYLGVSLRKDLDLQKQIGTRLWHRDAEDRRTVKIIIYLNDVDHDGGPFEYIPRSITPSYSPFKGMNSRITDKVMQRVVPSAQWKPCLGRAGTVIFADTTSVFHHGRVPTTPRSALFFTYVSRQPKRPSICNLHATNAQSLLLALAQTLPNRQKECVFWNPSLLSTVQSTPATLESETPQVELAI